MDVSQKPSSPPINATLSILVPTVMFALVAIAVGWVLGYTFGSIALAGGPTQPMAIICGPVALVAIRMGDNPATFYAITWGTGVLYGLYAVVLGMNRWKLKAVLGVAIFHAVGIGLLAAMYGRG